MWELLTLRPPWEGMDPFQLPVHAFVAILLLGPLRCLCAGISGFQKPAAAAAFNPSPRVPAHVPADYQRGGGAPHCALRSPHPVPFPVQCFHTDPSKRPRFEAVQRNLLIMVQQQQRR
jgi:hypothetical protein